MGGGCLGGVDWAAGAVGRCGADVIRVGLRRWGVAWGGLVDAAEVTTEALHVALQVVCFDVGLFGLGARACELGFLRLDAEDVARVVFDELRVLTLEFLDGR